MTLQTDELNFKLPWTFALWNAPGLHIAQQRYPDQPPQRSHEILSSMIVDSSLFLATQPFLLLEDIQLGICALQFDLWRYSQAAKRGKNGNLMSNLTLQKSLRERLDAWKRVLDDTVVEDIESIYAIDWAQVNFIPSGFYFGVEDHSQPGWQKTVSSRTDDLLFDTNILYHLFSMHLHADIRNLSILVESKRLSAHSKTLQVTEAREDEARQWAKIFCSRQAVWHAANILGMYHTTNGISEHFIKETLDPVAHAAMAVAALVV
jgi:hypothetical protein